MADNRQILIDQMEAGYVLGDRFSGLLCVNKKPGGIAITDAGSLSVVFKANDFHTGREVAVKFLDPTISGRDLVYRYQCFERESQILQGLIGNPRHLQLVLPLDQIYLTVTDGQGNGLSVGCSYLVTEWLQDDILDPFMNQGNFSSVERLWLFRQLSLAVYAMHREGIVHRDLKRDNFRVADRNGERIVVPIDLGTGAEVADKSDRISVYSPPGAPAFSPPESLFGGLGGVRELGRFGDLYALGTMLYGLFNPDLFIKQQYLDGGYTNFSNAATAYRLSLKNGDKVSQAISEWDRLLNANKRQVSVPRIDGQLNSIDAAVAPICQRILNALCSVDYRDRDISIEYLVRQIDACIRIVTNEAYARVLRERKRLYRANRLRNAKQIEHRFPELKNEPTNA